jgi:DNA-nicking Smr family endonuclease
VKSDEDEFARAMVGVRPLRPDRRGDRVHVKPNADERRVAPPAAGAPAPVEADGAADTDSYAADGVDRRELRKLKRGDYAPGDTLDVHGMTAPQADASVRRFIARNRARHRCVCIVHGRGLRSPGQVPVLKARVRDILRDHAAILAFADAPRDAGGAGAVYVLLRR